tara:strand:+ start:2905 stop:4740 length:1836 start_codon:yes stop_codon:yes gene_type:complete
MEGTSIDPTNEKLKQLQQLLPEAFTEGNVDWEKLKATLGEDINFANERYVLNWAGKSNAFKEIKTPTTKTLVPCKDESEDWDNTKHIFIEGENLDVLRTLQKSYHNKVKMIYIDPPYNTGKDSFVYPDKFSETKDEYQKRVGDKDEEGYLVNDCHFSTNSKENGQYHSNWLNMMYPRLHLAKNLLKEDGVIFVSIDDNEIHNLRLMMNEIFGEENFVAEFVWQKNFAPKNDNKYISTSHEYILCFAKSKLDFKRILLPRKEKHNKGYKNPDNDSRGDWTSGSIVATSFSEKGVFEVISPSGIKHLPPVGRCWRYSQKKIEELNQDDRLWWGKDGDGVPRVKRFLNEMPKGVVPQTWLKYEDVGSGQDGTQLTKSLFQNKQMFDFPKPITLINRFLQIGTEKDDIVFDFFSGSGTTAHSVLAINAEDGGNRKCISVQLAEPTDKKSEAFKEGYKHIADISKERIKRAAKKIKEDNPLFEGDLGMKVFKLQESNFKQWRQLNTTDANELAKQIKMFVDPVSGDAINENMLYELLLKSGKDLNSSVVLKDKVYYINDNELVILLDEVSQDIIDAVISETPNKVLVLDKLFSGNDKLKTNTKLQMDDAGIKFKTI